MTNNMVDMQSILAIGRQISVIAGRLHQREYNRETKADKRMPANAATARELLHLAHLLEIQRVAVLTEYHKIKGFESPTITP